MSRKFLLLLFVVFVVAVGYFLYSLYSRQNKSFLTENRPETSEVFTTPVPEITFQPGPLETFEGSITCLSINPGSDYVPEDEDCTLGLKTLDGSYFVLLGDFRPVELAEGQRIRVEGTLTVGPASYFNVKGEVQMLRFTLLDG